MADHCNVTYAECHILALYAECSYAECNYAECHCTLNVTSQGDDGVTVRVVGFVGDITIIAKIRSRTRPWLPFLIKPITHFESFKNLTVLIVRSYSLILQ